MSSATESSGLAQLAERLEDPRTVDSLGRLLDRVDQVETLLGKLAELTENAPNIVAMATDTLDETVQRAADSGIAVEQRLKNALKLADRLTEPNTSQAIEKLLERVEQIERASQTIDQLPGILAMLVDVMDEWAARLKSEGIDLETSLRRSLHAALWLGQQVSERELERLGVVLRSHVLDPGAIDIVGHSAVALAQCRSESCADGPPRVGLMGLLKALRDPEVQRSLGFALSFAKSFGAGAVCRGTTEPKSNQGDSNGE